VNDKLGLFSCIINDTDSDHLILGSSGVREMRSFKRGSWVTYANEGGFGSGLKEANRLQATTSAAVVGVVGVIMTSSSESERKETMLPTCLVGAIGPDILIAPDKLPVSMLMKLYERLW